MGALRPSQFFFQALGAGGNQRSSRNPAGARRDTVMCGRAARVEDSSAEIAMPSTARLPRNAARAASSPKNSSDAGTPKRTREPKGVLVRDSARE